MPLYRRNEPDAVIEDVHMKGREAIWSQALRAERRGDSAAYEAFLQDFTVVMRRIIASRLNRMGLAVEEAEDVLQEVLIAVHSRRGEWNASRPLMPWLNAITRYKTIDAARRLRRQGRGRIDLSEDEWARLFAAEDVDADHRRLDMQTLVAALSTGQQAAVRAVAIEGASHREAAERLGSSEGAVRIAFHRALKTLAAKLRDGE